MSVITVVTAGSLESRKASESELVIHVDSIYNINCAHESLLGI